jgi:hypothetical protein
MATLRPGWEEELEAVAAAEAAKKWTPPGPETIEGAYTDEHVNGRLLPTGIRKPIAGRADAPPTDPVLWPQNQAEPPKIIDLDPELTAAKETDENNALARGLERLGRNFTANMTGVKNDMAIAPTDAVARLKAAKEKARKDALETQKVENAGKQLTGMLEGNAERARQAQEALEENRRHNRVTEAQAATNKDFERMIASGELDLKKYLAWLAGKKADAGPEKRGVPASDAQDIADLPTALGQLDNLHGLFKKLNMGSSGSKASSALTGALGLQGTDAAEYTAAARATMQGVGKILEGGKLQAGDEIKYTKMLPQAGDSDAVVQQKMTTLKSLLNETVRRRVEALKATGFDADALGKLVGGAPAASPAQPSGPIQMKFPDGSVHTVPQEKIESARKKGGVPQ